MITVYHLGVSQSDRIVWLMEELGLPYQLEWFDRGPDGLAPPAYLALHPAATAPVIRDGDRVLAESAAICEYICNRYAKGKLSVNAEQDNYADYLYWMQMNSNLLGLFFAKAAAGEKTDSNAMILSAMERREKDYYSLLDQRLSEAPYLAGEAFSCADIMIMFNLTSLPLFGGRSIDDMANISAYVQRISQRPAYIKAMQIAGPQAQRAS
ncbi:MAG: glutathione S-transferase [Zhongshania sp.]|uniref:glutathione S-transferase family protein n=1 Tax=Zhongshania sp. TaxID=1971902 RepID=UPI00262AF3E2|nr:glutathione S-transferase [Zhongshania sp.]MDF1693673.1 glutathione S-transferase [Zhongshania sp.]